MINESLGNVFVEVMIKGLDKANKSIESFAKQGFKMDTREAEKKILNLQKQLDKLAKPVKITLDVGEAEKQIIDLRKQLTDMRLGSVKQQSQSSSNSGGSSFTPFALAALAMDLGSLEKLNKIAMLMVNRGTTTNFFSSGGGVAPLLGFAPEPKPKSTPPTRHITFDIDSPSLDVDPTKWMEFMNKGFPKKPGKLTAQEMIDNIFAGKGKVDTAVPGMKGADLPPRVAPMLINGVVPPPFIPSHNVPSTFGGGPGKGNTIPGASGSGWFGWLKDINWEDISKGLNKIALSAAAASYGMLAFVKAASPLDWNDFQVQLYGVQVQIGRMFIPVVREATTWLEGLKEGMKGLSDDTRSMIAGFGKWIVVIGGVALAVKGLMAVLGLLSALLNPLVLIGGLLGVTAVASMTPGSREFISNVQQNAAILGQPGHVINRRDYESNIPVGLRDRLERPGNGMANMYYAGVLLNQTRQELSQIPNGSEVGERVVERLKRMQNNNAGTFRDLNRREAVLSEMFPNMSPSEIRDLGQGPTASQRVLRMLSPGQRQQVMDLNRLDLGGENLSQQQLEDARRITSGAQNTQTLQNRILTLLGILATGRIPQGNESAFQGRFTSPASIFPLRDAWTRAMTFDPNNLENRKFQEMVQQTSLLRGINTNTANIQPPPVNPAVPAGVIQNGP